MSERINLEIDPFVLTDPPATMQDEDVVWLYQELKRLQQSVDHLIEAAPQATNKAPFQPRAGTIRWNLDPWNPTGDGLEGFVQYNGSSWTALSARA